MSARGLGGVGRPAPRRGVRGVVTVELAIGFVVLVMVTVTLAGGALLATKQAACADTASHVARQTARDDREAVAEAVSRAPDGAMVTVTREPGGVAVEVRLAVPVFRIGEVILTGKAWAAYEPGVSP